LLKEDYVLTERKKVPPKMVSGEAVIINKEETGSLKEKRDY